MNNNKYPIPKHQEDFLHQMMKLFDVWATIFFLIFSFFFLYAFDFLPEWSQEKKTLPTMAQIPAEEDPNRIEDGIHVRTGLQVDEHYELVINHCGACHSHKLVTQNRADTKGWIETIRWMQKTQKLWDLGADEAKIVAYLSKNYGAKKKSRRVALQVDEWYEL